MLAERYINDRFLPDKAIDLLDEACACAALRNLPMAEYDAAMFQLDNLRSRRRPSPLTAWTRTMKSWRKPGMRLPGWSSRPRSWPRPPQSAKLEEQDLAKVIELWTGIPASRIQESELKKLAHLEERLSARVIGQEEAVKAVAAARAPKPGAGKPPAAVPLPLSL